MMHPAFGGTRTAFLLATALLAVLLAAPLTAAETPSAAKAAEAPGIPAGALPTIALDEIQRGQHGYGLSVFAGTEPERFDVEVIGIMRNVSPNVSYILARLTGKGLEKSGVAGGMSGSPVFLDGRLAGAVAFSWPFTNEAIAGITPIGSMRQLSGLKAIALSPPPPQIKLSDILSNHLPKDLLATQFGRLLPHFTDGAAPAVRPPSDLETIDQQGDFIIKTKKRGRMYGIHYGHHPFDVVGWDGCCYPFAFSIHDFEPITGRVHQPPPVHQTFEGHNYVVCSFCPRLFDYHPQAIPAPYNHSNIDSDELLYYVDGDFMSRKNVTRGMLTLHPGGIPHGPHPGAVERSIGAKETKELAVMVDTFHPLSLTAEALEIENPGYTMSWAE